MSQRINIKKLAPAGYAAVVGLENYLTTTRLSPLHHELVRIRASQINGCTYCIDKHTQDAIAQGASIRQLFALTNWGETDFFTEEEQAILAVTEEVTLIPQGLSDETYARAARVFDEEYLAQLIMAVIVINAWNRIGVSTHMKPALH
ncbi:carboxymuconolactone decarboxylase family protein [Chitinophaga deserti]|uniref:carboxymuconolactone decarboxylase family protein n=1 Tax=Chitinophaga deserti TaxID=2164099 RepID=UPI000D6DA0CC|nr:carboxymuconolactone decarboxylase family protein [Chitinophaga deserti]